MTESETFVAQPTLIPQPDERSIDQPLDERWQHVLATRGAETAAADDAATISYAELDRLSSSAAARLRALVPAGAAQPVVLLTDHDRFAAVGAIAAVKAGLPCITLDPQAPLERLRQVVEASGAASALVATGHAHLARSLGLPAVVDLTDGNAAIPAQPARWPGAPTDIHTIAYTSGSTGAPKGVAAPYRLIGHAAAIVADADWCRPTDAVGLLMPLQFAGAQGVLLSSLFLGAAVHFYEPRSRGAGPLEGWLADHRITVLTAPPSLLTALTRATGGRQLSDTLRVVRSSGEKVLCSEARAIRAVLPASTRFVNVLGASETTLVSSYEVTDETPDLPQPVPAGWPVLDREIRIEDEAGAPVPTGEKGELVVVSAHLPVGYWRDDVRTRQRYTPLPDGRVAVRTGDLAVALPTGAFRLAGRKDFAVKIRGNLVEPAEVEAALLEIEGVAETVVVGRPRPTGGDRLVGYVVAKETGRVLRTHEVRRTLRKRLPAYMVPEALVFLAELPRTDRGKIDRQRLPEPPPRQAEQGRAPATEWERTVARIWCASLELESVGLDEDFFDLGGDSLAAEELVTRLAEETGRSVPSRLLLDAPTLAEFAHAAAAPAQIGPVGLVPLRRTGTRPPLFCVAGAGGLGLVFQPLARALGSDQPVWALQSRVREGRRPPEVSVRRLARRHVRAVRSVQPSGPYLLAGHSFGAIVAFEMAQQLRAAGERVALLVSLDSLPPNPKALPKVRRRSAAEWLRLAKKLVVTSSGRKPDGVTTDYVSQSNAIARFYRGKPYAGRTLVTYARDERVPEHMRSTLWRPYLTGRARLQEVPGTHLSMVREPHVQVLAEALRAEIDAALR